MKVSHVLFHISICISCDIFTRTIAITIKNPPFLNIKFFTII